jgi:putative transposase
LAVDLGIINTAVTCDTDGNTNIYSGKQVLAMQHYFNKEKAKLTSVLTKQYPKRHQSRALRILQNKQTRQINQSLHTHTKAIVNNCLDKGIKTLVVGDVTDIRKDKNFGHKNNQKLHSWSFSKFTQQLEYKCMKVGIRFVRVNEAYSSQTCSHCGKSGKQIESTGDIMSVKLVDIRLMQM